MDQLEKVSSPFFLSPYECWPLLRAWKMAFPVPSVQITLPPLRLGVLVELTLTWKAHGCPCLKGMLAIFGLPLPLSSPPLPYLSLCPWRLTETASARLHCPLVSNWVLPVGNSKGIVGGRDLFLQPSPCGIPSGSLYPVAKGHSFSWIFLGLL